MKSVSYFAFAAGKVSTEGSSIKRYIGIAPCFVKAVNPSKKELESIYNTQIESDPQYVSTTKVTINNVEQEVPQVRLDFIIETNEEKCGVALKSKAAFFLTKSYRFNKDATKVQVIDKYGRTAWVTKEQAKNHEIPMYSNGPANLDKDYRPCYIGEEELTNFIITYLRVPSVMRYVNNTWIMSDTPEDSEARLDNIENYFKGDFSELKSVLSLQPNNQVKIMFGVRTMDDGKQYQAVYTRKVLGNNVTDYSKIEKEYQDRKDAGAFPTTEFAICDLKEYVVESTSFSEPEDLPDSSSPWFAN